MKFWEYLLKIDRRLIFLFVGLAVLVPVLVPFKIPTNVMPPTQKLYDAVDGIAPGSQGILLSVDYDPQTNAELQPMYVALLRHAFARRVPVFVMSTSIFGLGLGKNGLDQVALEFNQKARASKDSIIYGRDYVFLGWSPLWLAAVLRMGSDIGQAFPADYYKNRTSSLDMLQHLKNWNDIAIIVSIAGSSAPSAWIVFVNTRFGVRVGAGLTAVSAPDFYPFLNTGQLTGMMAGLKGASEYEYMVNKNYHVTGPTPATQGMSSQSVANVVIFVLIILGNIGYFATRRRKNES